MLQFATGRKVERGDFWHGSSDSDPEYVNNLPEDVGNAIESDEFQWLRDEVVSDRFQRVRKRAIEIRHDLLDEREVPKRRALLDEFDALVGRMNAKPHVQCG